VDRATKLTAQLLDFGRRRMVRPQVIDPNALLVGTKGLLCSLIGEHIEIVFSFDESPVRISIDPTQLEQIIVNLAINARDAMPKGGTLTIATTCMPSTTDLSDDSRSSEHFVIRVSDTGSGMSEETMAHLFEPFFTTKRDGQGTGLGLASSYGIVKQSGGNIDVESTQGVGTTFSLRFPIVDHAVD
jgi:signal transduction histidine kinase